MNHASTLKNIFFRLKNSFKKLLGNNQNRILLLIVLIFLLIVIRIIAGFNGLYGQDAYEYLRYSGRLDHFFYSGINPGQFFWPVGYPLAGAILNLIINNSDISLQLISLFAFVFSVIYIDKFLELFFDDTSNKRIYFVILFYFLSPYLFRSAFLVMSESLSVLCIIGLLYHLCKYSKNNSIRDFTLAIFFIMLSLITRYVNFVVILIPSIYLLVLFLKKFDLRKLIIGLAIVVLAVLPHLIIDRGNSMSFLGHEWLKEWSVKNFFSAGFLTANGYETYGQINIIYPFSNLIYPAFIFSGILFLFFLRVEDFKKNYFKIIVSSLLLYFIFLAGIPYQDFRFLIPAYPLAILLLYPGFLRVTDKFLKKKYRKPAFIIFLIIQCMLIYKYSIGIYNLNKFEKETANILMNYDGSRTLYTFYLNGALKYYGIRNKLVNLYDSKISDVNAGSYVLFNKSKFQMQWKNELPMINWKYLKSNYNLKELFRLPGSYQQSGWILYEINK